MTTDQCSLKMSIVPLSLRMLLWELPWPSYQPLMETQAPMERSLTASLGLQVTLYLPLSAQSCEACSSPPPGAVFSINSTTGVVTVSGEVNFEMGQEHELSVEARDSGNPQRSHVVPLHIVVINADDENPRFPISFYTAAIDEGKMLSLDIWV